MAFGILVARMPALLLALEDIDTRNEKLRLQVQWALGRVSDDTYEKNL